MLLLPANKPMVRNDNNDLVFLTKSASKALIKEVEAVTKNNGPY